MKRSSLMLMLGGVVLTAASAFADLGIDHPKVRDTLRQFTAPCLIDPENSFYERTVVEEIRLHIRQGFKVVGVTRLDSTIENENHTRWAPNTCVYTFVRQ